MTRNRLFAGGLLLATAMLVAVAVDAGQRAPAAAGGAAAQAIKRDAMLMFNSGASVAQIRTAIDQKWGSRFPSHTPTPNPPSTRPSRG